MRATPMGVDGLIAPVVAHLFDDKRRPAALEHQLAAAIGRPAVLVLIATVGFYSVLGYILMTYATPVDDWVFAEIIAEPL
jgi:4-carboxymuconolactone decarboxylase